MRPHVSPLLQNLRVSDAGVGHVTVNSTPPSPAWPRPSSPGNCLIVTDLLAAERNVVHAALIRNKKTIATNQQSTQRKPFLCTQTCWSVVFFLHFLTCEAAHTSNALKMTSTTLWDVSTFPPTTAAFWEGWRIEPGGMMTLIGARQPWM